MLPFLAKKKSGAAQTGIAIKTRTPDEQPEQQDQDDPSAAIKACSKALIAAIHSHNEQGVADALSDAFEILESMPHEESVEPHSFEAQDE